MRSAVLLGLLLLAPGCDRLLGIPDPSLRDSGGGGGDDASTDGPQSTQITILARDVHHLEDGTTIDHPHPPASISMDVFRLAGGVFSAPIAVTLADAATGTWVVDGIPPGEEYYLRYSYFGSTNQYLVTRARTVDLGLDATGRIDPALAAAGSALVLDVGNMTPWKAGDQLQLVAANASAGWGPMAEGDIPGGVAVNATSLNNVNLGWEGTPLVRGSLGDSLRVLHLTERTIGGGLTSHMVADQYLANPPIEQTDGASTPVDGFFSSVPANNPTSIDWRLSELHDALAVPSGPPVTPGSSSLEITVPGVSLLSTGTLQTADVNLGTVNFANPFPATVTPIRWVNAFGGVVYQVPGAAPVGPFDGDSYGPWILMMERVADASATIGAPLHPPIDIRIADQPLTEVPPASTPVRVDQPLVVTWQDDPASSTAATRYRARIFILFRETDGTTRRLRVLTIMTGSPGFTVPAGVLEPNRYYSLLVTAEHRGALDESAPFRLDYPSLEAQVVSGMFFTYDPALPDAGPDTPDAAPPEIDASL